MEWIGPVVARPVVSVLAVCVLFASAASALAAEATTLIVAAGLSELECGASHSACLSGLI